MTTDEPVTSFSLPRPFTPEEIHALRQDRKTAWSAGNGRWLATIDALTSSYSALGDPEDDPPFDLEDEQRRCQIAAEALTAGDLWQAALVLYGTQSRIAQEFLRRRDTDEQSTSIAPLTRVNEINHPEEDA